MVKERGGKDGILSDSPGLWILKRGGEADACGGGSGFVLKLKPVMRLTEDGTRLDKFFVKRTMSAAVSGIMDHMKKKGIDGAVSPLYRPCGGSQRSRSHP